MDYYSIRWRWPRSWYQKSRVCIYIDNRWSYPRNVHQIGKDCSRIRRFGFGIVCQWNLGNNCNWSCSRHRCSCHCDKDSIDNRLCLSRRMHQWILVDIRTYTLLSNPDTFHRSCMAMMRNRRCWFGSVNQQNHRHRYTWMSLWDRCKFRCSGKALRRIRRCLSRIGFPWNLKDTRKGNISITDLNILFIFLFFSRYVLSISLCCHKYENKGWYQSD